MFDLNAFLVTMRNAIQLQLNLELNSISGDDSTTKQIQLLNTAILLISDAQLSDNSQDNNRDQYVNNNQGNNSGQYVSNSQDNNRDQYVSNSQGNNNDQYVSNNQRANNNSQSNSNHLLPQSNSSNEELSLIKQYLADPFHTLLRNYRVNLGNTHDVNIIKLLAKFALLEAIKEEVTKNYPSQENLTTPLNTLEQNLSHQWKNTSQQYLIHLTEYEQNIISNHRRSSKYAAGIYLMLTMYMLYNTYTETSSTKRMSVNLVISSIIFKSLTQFFPSQFGFFANNDNSHPARLAKNLEKIKIDIKDMTEKWPGLEKVVARSLVSNS